jgi:putative addiction module killer protein
MVEARRRELRNYVDARQHEPFQDWLDDLDSVTRNVIQARLIRVSRGNFGDCHGVGEGVSEFRIDFGPGYRVYFGQDGDVVILLTGGTKRTQKKDIATAKDYWRDYHA